MPQRVAVNKNYNFPITVQEPGNNLVASKKKKAAPKSSLCGHPTTCKGHKKVSTSPKNQKKTIVVVI